MELGWGERVLRLTLKRKWFDMIASGEKREEYRTPGKWILSRLIGKNYDVVEFSNGYGKHVPRIVVKYLGWHQGPGRSEWGGTWQNRYAVIRLGHVISRHNAERINPDETKDDEGADDAACSALKILQGCGLHGGYYNTIKKAAEGARDLIRSLRADLYDPPHDIQCAVLCKLGVEGFTKEGVAPTLRLIPLPNAE